MIRALWLTSWYPNKSDAMAGDFIQRHARAASLFCKIDVIHVEVDKNNVLMKNIDVEVKKQNNLCETIVLYKSFKNPFGKIVSLISYFRLFRKYVEQYIQAEGKPDVVHVHVPMKAGLIALWLKRKYNIPYVVTEHWTIYNDAAENAYRNRNAFFKLFTKKIFTNAERFLPVSNDLGKAVGQMVTPVSFSIIPNVADTNFFNDKFLRDENKNVFRFIHVSVLNHQKNPEGILRAYEKFCKEFSSTELVIVGDNFTQLEQYASELEIPVKNIFFKGLIPYEKVAEEMKRADALVMFSRFENLPCVIIEALCCGLPVISTNVGGIPELIDESNGILINNEDEDALLHSVQQLYLSYKNYDRHQIAETAQKNFSYQAVGEQIHDAYREVLSKISGKQ
jgi:glycosyltransferase involved in cell wall biosynthesis